MKNWENQLMNHILNEKYLGEADSPKMPKEDKKAFLSAVGNFHEIGEMVYSNAKLNEVTKTLENIMQQAEALTLQESEHWFDNVTVSRHMKQMNEAYKVFEKTATEMSSLQQRLESAYDDMGTVLNRYYNVNGALSEDNHNPEAPDSTNSKNDDLMAGAKIEEDQFTAGVHNQGPAFNDHMTATDSKRLK